MRTKELIAQLTEIGLSDAESRVYIASLKSGPALLAPLASLAEVPRSSAYEVVESLLAKHLLIISSLGKRTIYAASAPTQLLKDVLEKEQIVRTLMPLLEQLAPSKSPQSSDAQELMQFDLD